MRRLLLLLLLFALSACDGNRTGNPTLNISGVDGVAADTDASGLLDTVSPVDGQSDLSDGTLLDANGDTQQGDQSQPVDLTTLADSDTTTGVDTLITPGAIQIYLTGDYSPYNIDDGLEGQTPFEFKIAISKYYTLKSEEDPSPYLCFEHNAPYVSDLSQDNLVGFCSTVTIPSATYTHGKVKVDWLQYSVNGRMQHGGVAYPGVFTVFRAYSNTTVGSIPYKPGDGFIHYNGVVDVIIPYKFDDIPEAAGIKTELVKGEFLMTFPYTHPLPIVQNGTQSHWARFNWQVKDAFRWQDKDLLGYSEGEWDVSPAISFSEQVKLPGVSGYYVTSSID